MAYKDPIRRREAVIEWKKNNPEKLKAQRARYEKEHYQRLRLTSLGWTEAQYATALVTQNNSCDICKEPFLKTPHADHCHATGRARALLCGRCNSGLGMFRDRPELLEAAAQYLKFFEGCTVPPEGWWCSREKGHEGPCAARPSNRNKYAG